MKYKHLYIVIILFFTKTNIFSQTTYQVVKLDRESIENFVLIYLKKSNSQKYFRITVKNNQDTKNCKTINVGSVLLLKLTKNKESKIFKDSKDFGKNNIFYKDSFEGNNVNLNYYCTELENICPNGSDMR